MNNRLLDVFVKEAILPYRVFNSDIQFFIAFEPSLILDSFFFNSLLSFLKNYKQEEIIAKELIGEKEFRLKTKEINYDYWTDKVFSIDGLFYTETGITSESQNWGIFLDNVSFEIGIVGFKDHLQKEKFMDAFGEDRNIFESLGNYIMNMDSMLNFSNEARIRYNEVIKNHASN